MDPPGPADLAPRAGERAAAVLGDRRAMVMMVSFGVMAFVVVTVIGFSGAFFTSTSTSPDNTFSAGSVDITLSAAGSLLDGSGLYPGQSRTGTQTVTNVGHAATVTLGATGFGPETRLADVLVVTVSETTPASRQLFTGTLRALQGVDLGRFAADEKRGYTITVQWPKDQASPTLQGAVVSFDFTWLASSAS